MHLSLRDKEISAPAFYDPDGPYGTTELLRRVIGGLQKHLLDWGLLSLPNVNSFKRVIPDAWAPVFPNCGYENGTCALRAVGRGAGSNVLRSFCEARPRIPISRWHLSSRLGGLRR